MNIWATRYFQISGVKEYCVNVVVKEKSKRQASTVDELYQGRLLDSKSGGALAVGLT